MFLYFFKEYLMKLILFNEKISKRKMLKIEVKDD